MATTAIPRDFQPRRGKARLRAGIPAYLNTVHGRCRVTLLDLSESGACVRYDGEQIRDGVLEWLGYEVFGSVVRRGSHELGLRFDDPIAQAWVLETRDRLPEIARAEDQVSRFAREWARGRDSRADPASSTARRARAMAYSLPATKRRAGARERTSAAVSWFHTAKPFLLGGVVVGVLAGYASAFL